MATFASCDGMAEAALENCLTSELPDVFIAARRPPAGLDAERRDRHLARSRRQQQIDRQHAVLLAALHDIAGLNIDLVLAGILHRQFIDAAGLADLDDPLGQRLLQGQRHSAAASRAVYEIDRKVVVNDRTGDLYAGVGKGRRSKWKRRKERRDKMHKCSAAHGITLPMMVAARMSMRSVVGSRAGGGGFWGSSWRAARRHPGFPFAGGFPIT